VKSPGILVAAMIFAGAIASAQTGRYSATLAQPLSSKQVIANGNIWNCKGSVCELVSYPNHPDSLQSCHDLQHQVGVLTAYGTKEKPFDSDLLAKCNGKH
jgi:hypothetical protein